MSTPYHTKYLAHELTRKVSADNAEKLSQSLINATVDLNPHQVEAALFAFKSPLSKGAILADEVGLGKTIEAGLIVTQLWAERKRRILCIVPASLRKQWNRELADKFFLQSDILESSTYREAKRDGSINPFDRPGRILVCSYQFARAKVADVQRVPWDLVVMDEAHRLRNVYKKSNKIARAIRDAIGSAPKVLLTATPLQNSLMELYGLVTFIDPHVFGSEESFRAQFASPAGGQYESLKARLAPICQRTLRRQVREYVPYTNRVSITQDFTPTDAEVNLYESVSAYLQRPELFALPAGQRKLITLILRKILASSSFAIAATLGTMIERLESLQIDMAGRVPAEQVEKLLGDDFEAAGEVEEEWSEAAEEDAPDSERPQGGLSDEQEQRAKLTAILGEIKDLKGFKVAAESIAENAKGRELLTALKLGFIKAAELGAPRKALIFTESRRTQTYLKGMLEENGYAGDIVLFNGTNTDPDSRAIYQNWRERHEGGDNFTGSPSSDMRSALVEEFRDRKAVMIATESAAEGVNLQFCNLVVNYDLPWNPQRIEQRIGRCHRYGQKHDVVVVNFLNRRNEADQRVFQLLQQKFRLFDGVFGASDEVLGVLDSGVDFEKRINEIYQSCRTTNEINAAFDQLQDELEAQIQTGMSDARSKLLEHFDEEVGQRLRVRNEETRLQLDRYAHALWRLTQIELGTLGSFDPAAFAFELLEKPGALGVQVPLGRYRLVTERGESDELHYRLGHPLAEFLVGRAKQRSLDTRELTFDYEAHGAKITLIENLCGKSGWLKFSLLTVTALDAEEHLLLSGCCDDGAVLDDETCRKLFAVPATIGTMAHLPPPLASILEQRLVTLRHDVLGDAMRRNQSYFDDECTKLDNWADDLRDNLERELKDLERDMKAAARQAKATADLDAKVALRKQAADLEKQRNEKRRNLYDEQDRIAAQRDGLIGAMEEKLKQRTEEREVFTIRWVVP